MSITTGATDAQIEAAQARYEPFRNGWNDAIVEEVARRLVPPDHRIIDADDLAALRRVLEAYKAATDALNILWEGTANASDAHDDRRLAALIGDDGNG